MKKVLLTAMTLVSIATSSVFGYYGANNDWIDFLTDGNQLRARTRQIGFVLGNGTIKGVFGLRDESETALGQILSSGSIKPDPDKLDSDPKYYLKFMPTLSAGIGYTTEAFGIGIGYNYRYYHDVLRVGATKPDGNPVDNAIALKSGLGLSVHTPVVTMNFLNNNLRIAIPVQVAVHNGDIKDDSDKKKYMGISLDPQIRYYTGIPAFNEVRLTIKYGMNQYTYPTGADKTETASVSSFGFDFRAYFGAQVGDVGLKPFLKITYDTALDKDSSAAAYGITAGSGKLPTKLANGADPNFDSNPWELNILPTLGLSANSDIVNLYLEAGLGYKAVNTGYKYDPKATNPGPNSERKDPNKSGIQHSLAWSSYAEISIRPVQDLEWYFEAEIGNAGSYGERANGGDPVFVNKDALKFNSATGITWYLPSLQ